MTNAWTLLIVSSQRYSGNDGYENVPSERYVFDNFVQNHKAISADDIVVIREDDDISGVSIVDRKEEQDDFKPLKSCPECGSRKIRDRKKASPKWACENKHFFAEPHVDHRPVKKYTVYYKSNFQKLDNPVAWQLLNPYFSNTSTQQSIRKINLSALLQSKDDKLRGLVSAIRIILDNRQHVMDLGEDGDLSFAEDQDEYGVPTIAASSWTGQRSVQEVAKKLTVLGPAALEQLAAWVHYYEHERNDPNPPDGMPENLLEQLKALHNELGELINLGQVRPEAITAKRLQSFTETAKEALRPTIKHGQLMIAGVSLYGVRMLGGLACLQIMESITGNTIEINSGPGATLFAAGVAAATINVTKKEKKS
ncbi:hypothetical protein [Kordiimonas marina]|uniref:hypothetical protein n=1 Tax=Kordiimonas marina TaxID=2872312 RepID=UPI001FF6CB45|nr:hypothetical protein [Kordiimonas marina]MCJ9430730.1 hypothetical protein [Kordiimonas marina]